MAKTEEKTEVAKAPVSILDKDGKYAPLSLTEINKQAHGAMIGRKARLKQAMKEMHAAVARAVVRS